MTLRIKSAILRRTGSMRRTSLVGLKDTINNRRLTLADNGSYGSNEYIHKSFYDGENYQSIIECLDGGYKVAVDLIELMQNYADLLLEHIQSLRSYTKKWKSKLKHQPSLSSYHTTKRAQLQTICSPDDLAQVEQSRYDEIQQVIDTYRRLVERMYPRERLGTGHKHYRTDYLRKLFKNARSDLLKTSDKLEKLREQEKKVQAALHDADVQCQNFSFDPTANKNKVIRANDHQEKKQRELQQIKEDVLEVEQEFNQRQENYRQKATEIYLQFRDLEKERLDQIQETLIKFIPAAYSSEYSTRHNTIFEELLCNIKTQQDSVADLDFWASIYQVDFLVKSISVDPNEDDGDNDNSNSQTTMRKTKKSHKSETENLTTTENTSPSVAENEEEQAVTGKNKQRKKKNNTTTEPITPSATELN